MNEGVVFVVYGKPAQAAFKAATRGLGMFSPALPITRHTGMIRGYNNVENSRFAKVTLLDWSPYDLTLYMDADIVPKADVSQPFQFLKDGWDMVITASDNQGDEALWHLDTPDRDHTLISWGCIPLQLQCGLMWIKRSPLMIRFFNRWKSEWMKYKGQDQGAFLRALNRIPIRLLVLDKSYRDHLIRHNHGMARS